MILRRSPWEIEGENGCNNIDNVDAKLDAPPAAASHSIPNTVGAAGRYGTKWSGVEYGFNFRTK